MPANDTPTAGTVNSDPNSILIDGLHRALSAGPLLAKSPAIALAVAKQGGDIEHSAASLHLLAQFNAWDRAAKELQDHEASRLPTETNVWGP